MGYNAQIAVDSKHHLIAKQQVHSKVSDLGLLAQTATAARENLAVDEIDAVADGGYYKIEDIEDCGGGGITPFVPKPDRSPPRSSGHFTKSEFEYDAATDTYRCPPSQHLVPLYRDSAGKTRDGTCVLSYVNRAACRSCDLRDRCTKGTHRRIARYENEATMDRMVDRLAARPEVMNRRRESVEHPLRFDQAADGPGRVPDASTRQRPRGVQPHRLGLQHATRDQSRGNSRDDRRGSRLNPYFARFQGDNQPESGPGAITAVPRTTDTADAPTDRRRRREPASALKPRCCRISDPRLGLLTRSGLFFGRCGVIVGSGYAAARGE